MTVAALGLRTGAKVRPLAHRASGASASTSRRHLDWSSKYVRQGVQALDQEVVPQPDVGRPGAGRRGPSSLTSRRWNSASCRRRSTISRRPTPKRATSSGPSVAIFGDTMVVGARRRTAMRRAIDGNQADNSALNAGAAYVFVRSGTTWTQQAYLKASNSAASDQFGYSVAISGDTIAVGAIGQSSSSGAVYVFTRSAGSWSQEAFIKASNAGSGDSFGYRVFHLGRHDRGRALRPRPAMRRAWTATRPTTRPPPPEPPTCSRAAAPASGRSRPMSKLPTRSRATASASRSTSPAIRSWSALREKTAPATGIAGNQTDNSASNAGASVCVHAQRLDVVAAGLRQSVQHRTR